MNRRITLSSYTFIFSKFRSKEGETLAQLEYYDHTQSNALHVTVKRENVEKDVLPYKPIFNAEYAIEDLPEEVFDDLYDKKLLTSLLDWLVTNYSQLAFMEVINNAEENN